MIDRNICIDIVFCIDLTAGAKYLLEQFKNNFLDLITDVRNSFEPIRGHISKFRARIVSFRDFVEEEALFESDFYENPNDNEEFLRIINSLGAYGGGDIAENALEAIALALKSDWTTEGDMRRHIICVITDAPALELGERNQYPNYPSDMPKDIKELTSWYQEGIGTLDHRGRRFILFAPDDYTWMPVSDWDYCWHIHTDSDSDIEENLRAIPDMVW